jgi:hypothetical protein
VANLGGIQCLAKSLRSPFVPCQLNAARALYRLGHLPGNQPKLLEAGAVPPLLELAQGKSAASVADPYASPPPPMGRQTIPSPPMTSTLSGGPGGRGGFGNAGGGGGGGGSRPSSPFNDDVSAKMLQQDQAEAQRNAVKYKHERNAVEGDGGT